MRGRFIPVLVLAVVLPLVACANPVSVHLEQGDAYFEQHQWDEAVAEYSEAIKLDPELARAYSKRGWTYTMLGKLDLALADLDKAIELDPGLVEAYSHRAAVHHSQGQWDLAIADLNKAIELDPGLAAAYSNRGWTYASKGEPDRALTDLNKAIDQIKKEGKIRAMNTPWIAAINGPCFGVGLSLACCCDFRVTSAKAKLSVAFTGVGLSPDSSLLYYLPRILGHF